MPPSISMWKAFVSLYSRTACEQSFPVLTRIICLLANRKRLVSPILFLHSEEFQGGRHEEEGTNYEFVRAKLDKDD